MFSVFARRRFSASPLSRLKEKSFVDKENEIKILQRDGKKEENRNAFWEHHTKNVPKFLDKVAGSLKKNENQSILQLNLGRLCNLVCRHCHVESGPTFQGESFNMPKFVIDHILNLLKNTKRNTIQTVDLTGGAPELNPHFRYIVTESKKMNLHVLDRCNLVVLFEKGQEDLGEFLRDNRVEIIASLPCYSSKNVNLQRGKNVFEDSIIALQTLNALGYGNPNEPHLKLNLVYNPVGPSLPGNQNQLELAYKQKLKDDFGILFNALYTITNMPIKRFADDLNNEGTLNDYMTLLVDNFNPKTIDGLMCKNTINIKWNGNIYDCDFNSMLELESFPLSKLNKKQANNNSNNSNNDDKQNVSKKRSGVSIFDLDSFDDLSGHKIRTDKHCFGCTANAGSSCGGTII